MAKPIVVLDGDRLGGRRVSVDHVVTRLAGALPSGVRGAGRYLRAELAAKNVFVACEADGDCCYLANLLSDEIMVAGTEYGHNDIGSELGFIPLS